MKLKKKKSYHRKERNMSNLKDRVSALEKEMADLKRQLEIRPIETIMSDEERTRRIAELQKTIP